MFHDSRAPPVILTLSLHDALPISLLLVGRDLCVPPLVRTDGEIRMAPGHRPTRAGTGAMALRPGVPPSADGGLRSEEHTSELQSRGHLVCRLLLEKKKNMRKVNKL